MRKEYGAPTHEVVEPQHTKDLFESLEHCHQPKSVFFEAYVRYDRWPFMSFHDYFTFILLYYSIN